MKSDKILMDIYHKLYTHFGPQHWWPAKSSFEVMVGAVLTQNTAWPNVEKAIRNLKRAKLLSPQRIEDTPCSKLRAFIKPSGFYNEKSKKLKSLVRFLIKSRKGDINRKKLLDVKGIGPETADSILLYALNKPIFVVDAYTKRILARHKLIPENATYGETQKFFMENLPKRVKLFNEYHALIVETAKTYCKKNKPLCGNCPLYMV